MKKKLLFCSFLAVNLFYSQTEINVNSTNLKKIDVGAPVNISKDAIYSRSTAASVISPLSQTISSGSAITNITATPTIFTSLSKLDVITGGSGTLIPNANNGIFFDLANNSTEAVRVTSADFVLFASTATTDNQNVPFSIYRTTTASTAVGNYTTSSAWTAVLLNATVALAPTAAGSGFIITSNFGVANEFVLAPGQSIGMYILCNNTATTGWKLGYRTGATTGAAISDGSLTVTHRVRGTDLFATDSVVRGFYGNIYYFKGNNGSWTRNNTTNVTGTGNAADAGSATNTAVAGFPISGTLTNNSVTDQTVTYTITYRDVNNVSSSATATVTVLAATLGVSDSNKSSLKVYPNPVVDFIKISGNDKIKSAEIFDATGKKILLNVADNMIDVRKLPKGIYFVKINTDKGFISQKINKK